MAKQEKQELAVIDFTKFSVAQLPELKGKKEEIASIIEANPIVEIVDNGTYELAKKSRTAVKTLRTSLEKEQKDVKKKIKEHVLDVVDKEYDTIVLDVKLEEKSRQEPIDVWEEKKEQERQEKVRLEQERIDKIKTTISEFQEKWNQIIEESDFESISKNLESYNNDTVNFDVESLQEFEVLYADACSQIERHFELRTKTLTEQEQIRIDNLLIEEKNAENSRINTWQIQWNSSINTFGIDAISDIKKLFKESKLIGLKHYSAEYEEIYNSTEKRLHSQIELISKAEEQRIAQEKFLAEKKEFEEKQLEAKFQERKKFLVDEDYYRIYFVGECNEEESVFKSKLLAFSDSEFEDFKLAVLKSKEPVVETTQDVEFEENPFTQEAIEGIVVGPTEIVSNVVNNTHEFADFKEEQEYIEQVTSIKKEDTWQSIWEEYRDNIANYDEIKTQEDVLDQYIKWLETNYNVPTKKQ